MDAVCYHAVRETLNYEIFINLLVTLSLENWILSPFQSLK